MAENVNAPKPKGFEIPYFYGSSQDNLLAKNWTAAIDNAADLGNWTPQNTAQTAYMAMRDKAANWINNQRRGGNEAVNSWTTLKPLFEKRFHKTATLSQECALQDSLYQKKDESVNDFYDRVDSAQYVFDEKWPALEENATQAQRTQDAASKKASHKQGVYEKFLKGLKKNIKEVVVLKQVANLEDLLEKAVDVELSLGISGENASVAEIAEIENDEAEGAASLKPEKQRQNEAFNVDELKECVDFIKTQMRGNGRGFRGYRGQRGQFRGYGSRRGFNGPRSNRGGGRGRGQWQPPNEPNMKCYSCNQFGHRERYCPSRNNWQNGNARNDNGNVASIQVQENGNTFRYEDMFTKNEYMA